MDERQSLVVGHVYERDGEHYMYDGFDLLGFEGQHKFTNVTDIFGRRFFTTKKT